MKSVRPPPPVNEMVSQKIFFFTIDGFPKGKYQKYLCNMHRPIHVVANIYFTKISINDVYQGTQTWFDDGH